MDVFKFINPNGDTRLEQGELVNGITDLLWIERYRDAGEFTIKAPVDSTVRANLPTGTLISHLESTDVMIVENHEINSDRGSTADVVITGRSFETFLENRVAVPKYAFPSAPIAYTIPANFTWNQAVWLLDYHIKTAFDPNDNLPNVVSLTSVVGTSVSEARPVNRQTVYKTLLDILDVDDLGIKTVRPGEFSPFGSTSPDTALLVHVGVDRTADVIFSYDTGDIDSADYLWSIKSWKNAVLVTGKWVELMVKGSEAGYDRRTMVVDGSYIDSAYATAPTGAAYNAVVAAMTTLGNQVLAAQKELSIAKADVSRTVKHYEYRKDYDVGDIITVAGDYDETTRMRVIEYVEVEDKTGESGYPTLAKL